MKMTKKKIELREFDIANYLADEKAIAEYLNIELAEGDPRYIKLALANIARARNMSALSKKAGISRVGLYKALSPDSRPEYETILKIIKALDMRLVVVPNSADGLSAAA
jgi:probable addiction module antidote protein